MHLQPWAQAVAVTVTVPIPQRSAGALLGVLIGLPTHAPIMHGTTVRAKSLVQSSCKAQAEGCQKLLPARLEDEMASQRCLVQATHQSPSLRTSMAAAVEPLLSGSSLALASNRGGD